MSGRITRVSVAQTAPVWGDVAANIAAMVAIAGEAKSGAADLVVFPELATTGYVFDTEEELRATLADGDGLGDLARASADLGIVIVTGAARILDGDVHNCAVLLDNGVEKANYSKIHQWDTEKGRIVPGRALPPVVTTSAGRIGLAVCYDMEFPELFRHLVLGGAQIIAAPTNWPAGFEPPSAYGPFNSEMIRVMANASTNRVAVAVACRTGIERGVDWVDRSAIVGPDGFPLATAKPGSDLVFADVDLDDIDSKVISGHNDVLTDRRTDLY